MTIKDVWNKRTKVPDPSQLRNKHRHLLLPLLVVLTIAIPLIILILTHRHATNLQQQERHESWTHTRQPQRGHLPKQPITAQSHSHLRRPTDHDPRRRRRNARPKRTLAKIIRMPTLTPQTPRQEVLIMFLGLFLGHPVALLLVGCGFEGEAARVEQDADYVGDGDEGGEGGEDGEGQGVEGEDGEQAAGAPGCWGADGAEEFGG